MIEYENNCVGCPPNLGCLGDTCPNRNVPYLYCDECDADVETLYEDESGQQLCEECLLKRFKRIDIDDLC